MAQHSLEKVFRVRGCVAHALPSLMLFPHLGIYKCRTYVYPPSHVSTRPIGCTYIGWILAFSFDFYRFALIIIEIVCGVAPTRHEACCAAR